MSWYNNAGPCQNFVLFSKVKYIRNLTKQCFSEPLEDRKVCDAANKLETLLTSNGFQKECSAINDSPALLSLAERRLVDADFVYSKEKRSLYLNQPCNLAIALGGDNFISVSSITSGLSVIEAKNMSCEAEETLDRELQFAYCEKIGYVANRISDCGSGMTLSAAIYLPSLRHRSATRLMRELQVLGMSLRSMHTDGNAGDTYLISYTPHFLADEDQASVFFSDTVLRIVENEKATLLKHYDGKGKEVYNNARRALGTLQFSESISENEVLSLLSTIRLAYCLNTDIKEKSLPNVQALNFLSAEGLNASVISSAKEVCSSMEECDIARSTLIRRYIESKSEVV